MPECLADTFCCRLVSLHKAHGHQLLSSPSHNCWFPDRISCHDLGCSDTALHLQGVYHAALSNYVLNRLQMSPCGSSAGTCPQPAPINVWSQTGAYVLIAASEIVSVLSRHHVGHPLISRIVCQYHRTRIRVHQSSCQHEEVRSSI